MLKLSVADDANVQPLASLNDHRMSHPPPSPIYTLRGAGGPLNSLHFRCYGEDAPLLFSGSGKGCIHIWNLNTRRTNKVIEGHSGSSIIWVCTKRSKDTLISQGRDMQICLWDLGEGRCDLLDSVWTGSVGFCQCSMLETSPISSLLAFAGQQTEEPDSCPGPLLLAGYEEGSLLLWDVTQQSILSQVKAHPDPVMCLTFDPTRLRGISGSSEKNLSSWKLDEKNNLQLQGGVTLANPGVSQLCIREDGKLLASAGWDSRVRVFGWKKLRPLAVLQYHTDMVLSVAFSDHQDPRQRLMAAGSKDQRISLWSLYNES
ncbi:guanine nucleotide-binding protein subunit beta-like protein 1 isoform X3 [Gouania willdenowi]|uniref:Guanine nucleotide-binding protein subunit beta-like protein 1 n=1 Tax=Gouania willdenowi TaxID=441366 RepID=A0A8C5HC27_GOUWI|nr:guanine nucleotide-binding protein subunit beta-like protein 1 isoform X3 [Gouania willdenowi]